MVNRPKEKRGITRRSFLKTSVLTAGAVSLAGTGTASLSALADSGASTASEERVFVGRCVYGGCFGCERNVIVRDGHIVNMKPKEDAPYGRRPCGKGYSLMQRIHSEDRLKYPLRRVEGTPRGGGEWERITWDEAIAEISSKWKSYQEEFGSRSIAFVASGGGTSAGKIAASSRLGNELGVTSADTSSDWAIYWGFCTLFGETSVAYQPAPGNEPFEEDVFNAKNIVIWGDNVSAAHLQR